MKKSVASASGNELRISIRRCGVVPNGTDMDT